MNKLLTLIIALVVIAGGFYLAFKKPAVVHDDNITVAPAVITDFDECVAAGYGVMETYPKQCKTPDGKSFTQNIGNETEMADMIRIDSPRPNAKISSPLTITGQARGTWYFEASFPIVLLDKNGAQIGSGIAQAKSDWMTEDFVPYSATVEFTAPASATGTLILKKDNPSGLPENDKQLTVPVKF